MTAVVQLRDVTLLDGRQHEGAVSTDDKVAVFHGLVRAGSAA